MLELILVIIILGIVASIGAEIVANVYKQYILQRAQHRASLKTELAALQIANRLHYAIPKTIYRIRLNNVNTESIESPFPTGSSGDDYKGLQWVAYDGDSFEATNDNGTPGWSGFCDINSTSTNKDTLKTLGSNLSATDTIIQNLSNGSRSIATTMVYFPYDNTGHSVDGRTGDDQIDLDSSAVNRTISERYKLAWSSYAIRVDDGDLYLYYNFDPVPMAVPNDNNRQLLLSNVTTFKFRGGPGGIRFKLCKTEKISEDSNITACKEKVVF